LTAKQISDQNKAAARKAATAAHRNVAGQLHLEENAERARASLTGTTSKAYTAMGKEVAKLTSTHALTDVTMRHTQGMRAQLDAQRAAAWNAAQFAQGVAAKMAHDPAATKAQKAQAATLSRRAFTEYATVRAVDDKARQLARDTYTALRKQRTTEWHQTAGTMGHGGSWDARAHQTVVQIDGKAVFRAVQKQSLQSSRRNVNNLLTPA
jgi:hypothetical protein